MRRHWLLGILVATFAAGSFAPAAAATSASSPEASANGDTASRSARSTAAPPPAPLASTAHPCPASIAAHWTCVTLTVPVDYFHQTSRTTQVTFALKRHSGPGKAKGTWVTITGGPGTAGIYSAVDYTTYFAPAVRRDYDLVFMDQRGSGMSGAFNCPRAALTLYTNQAGANDPDGGLTLIRATHEFVDSCIAESHVDPTMLPYYGTRQAAEDLEAFRVWLGVDKLSLYGESYGTQYLQTYAAAHPEHVKALFLDGAVDLATEGPAFYVEGTDAFEQVLEATLLDCSSRQLCSRDVKGGNELTAYDQLAARLAHGPIKYTFTFADGHQERREFTSTDLENAAFTMLHNLTGRRLLQRAMAAASHGQVWWLARLAYAGVSQDADTLEPIVDPSWSDALYYAVECMDYAYFPNGGTPNQRASKYLDYGRRHGVFDQRLSGDYTGDLPCVFWPSQPGPEPRPLPDPNAPYPLIVMGATTDVATPFQNAQRIVEARGNNPAGTWLLYAPGGPHVIFGRGNACPDDMVTRILIHWKFPRQHTIACPGQLTAEYVQTPDRQQVIERGPLILLTAFDNEINYGVDYWFWDGASALKFGCAFGGTIEYVPNAKGSRIELDSCGFVKGAFASGIGQINDATGSFRLSVQFTGDWTGHAAYRHAANGRRSLAGDVRFSG